MARAAARGGVFINCPFDTAYKPMMDAAIFAVASCRFTVRTALEARDSGELRLDKIYRLIGECEHSIHDLSRVELDTASGLPRFNMPIELGIALGFRRFARRRVTPKLLVLDSERYRYQSYASDLAGLDISAHGNDPARLIDAVRDFLSIDRPGLSDADEIVTQYRAFEKWLPSAAKALRQRADKLSFIDRLRHIDSYIEISDARSLR
jgi:hypothetical protein